MGQYLNHGSYRQVEAATNKYKKFIHHIQNISKILDSKIHVEINFDHIVIHHSDDQPRIDNLAKTLAQIVKYGAAPYYESHESTVINCTIYEVLGEHTYDRIARGNIKLISDFANVGVSSDVYVVDNYQGRGIGQEWLDARLAIFSVFCNGVMASVSTNNEPQNHIMVKHGFRAINVVRQNVSESKELQLFNIYYKQLN